MSAAVDLGRLEAIIDSSGAPETIEEMLPRGVRARQLSVRSLLLGILICLADKRPAHLRRVHEALIGLPEAQQWRLGVIRQWESGPHRLSYRQTEYTFMRVVKVLAKEHPDGKPSRVLSETIDSLTEASVKLLGIPEACSHAVDWTDYESFGRPPPRSRTDNQENTGHEDTDEDGPGRCADPEASWGHRKVNHPAKAETFYGYHLQAVTIVAEENRPQVPELTRRITLSCCKEDPPQQIVPVITRMAKDGIQIGDLLADCGYSYRHPQSFAAPMRALGAALVIDLHPNDRGMKGTHQGAVISNGSLYCPATPKSLFTLGPPAPGASEEQLAAHDQKTAELSRYKLSPLSAPDADGYHRVICPAVKGKLRCPLHEESMALSHERPTITSPPEHPPTCCKQQTITIPPAVTAKTAQKHDYPSRAHRHSYARRTATERTFARLHDPATTNISRGWSRIMGLTPNALLIACASIITNIRTADAFTARTAEEQRRAECGLPPRRRRRRRETTHQPAPPNAHAPPATTA